MSKILRIKNIHFYFLLITIIICCLHLCQSIFFSKGDLIPGNLGDSRFVNLILEHNTQSLFGRQSLISPSQFFPEKNTLYFASNLFGTTPIYAIPRSLGFSMESSYQIWFILVEALNAISFFYVLIQLKINPFLRYPLVFAATSSSAFVFKIGHPQLLAIFPFFFALGFLVKFLQNPNFRSLAFFSLLLVFQHYCDIYQGFFASLISLILITFFVLLTPNKRRREYWLLLRSIRINLILLSSLLIVLLFILYFPYYLVTRDYGTRNINELIDLAPRLGAWFTASPYSLMYSKLNFIAGEPNLYEKCLFSGFISLIIMSFSLPFLLKFRKKLNLELLFCLSSFLTAIFLFLIMTTWQEPDKNIWLWCCEIFEPLRAFRAFARIGYLLFAVQVLAGAIVLNHLMVRYQEKWKFLSLVMVSYLCGIECVALDQAQEQNTFIHYSKQNAQQRVAGLRLSIDKNKAYDALVFCPGTVFYPWSVHLDAWDLSLKTGIPCLNGYSGGAPPSHVKFISSPTRPNAEELIERLNLDRSRVAFINSWSDEIEAKYRLFRYHLDERIKISSGFSSLVGRTGKIVKIKIKIYNPQSIDIPCEALNFHPSYRLYDVNGSLVPGYEPPRSPIPELKADSSTEHELVIQLPNKSGEYRILPCFVHEHVSWIDNLDSKDKKIRVTVE